MSETPYIETEFLLRVLNEDEEGGKRLMAEMSDRELGELRATLRTGRDWIEEEQYTRRRNREDAASERYTDGAGVSQQERSSTTSAQEESGVDGSGVHYLRDDPV